MKRILVSMVLACASAGCGGTVDAAPQIANCDGHSFIDLAVNSPPCSPEHPSCAFDYWGVPIDEASPLVASRFTCVDGRYEAYDVDPPPPH